MAQSFRTAISFDGLASASSQALAVKVDGDSQNRVLVDAGGKITWGAGGSSAGDTTLYRNAANVLKTDDGFVAASVTVPDGGLTLGSTAVTSTAAELNILDGVTSTASELNLVDGITAGTVSASKAVIADSNKDVTGFRNVTATGIVDAVNFKVNGGQGSDGQVLTSTGSGVAWENATGGGGSPGGSNTQIQFNNSSSFGGSANLTFDGTNLTLAGDATIGDTLILTGDAVSHISNNTDSGREILQLRGKTANSDGAGINLYGAGDSSNANKILFFSSNSTSMTLDASGNLGIGTTSPETPLNISTTNKLGSTFTGTVDGEGLRVDQSNYSAGNYVSLVEGSYQDDQTAAHVRIGAMYDGSGSHLVFGTTNNYGNGITNTAMEINETGEVRFSGDIYGTQGTNFFIGNDSNERVLFQESSNSIFFMANGTYRASFNSSGHFTPYADSSYNLGSTSNRWQYAHVDRYYVGDSDSYMEFEADGGAGVDGPGIRFVINGAEMFKVARENDDTNDTMLLLGENNDGIRYRKDDEKFAVVIGANDRFCVENATSSIYGSADILRLYTTASGDQSGYIGFYNNGTTRYGYMGYPANDDMYFKNENSGGQMYNFSPGSYIYWHVSGAYELRLSSSELRPYSNEGLNLGASGAAWNIFYLGQGSAFSSGGYWTLRSRDSDRQVMEYTSSERFKKDIVDLPVEEAYQILDARPIKFRGIEDDSSVPLEAGLSAESLHNAGFEYAVRYDEGHWGTTPRAVYYEMLTAPLIKICKDQKDRIESLEARVAALES